MIRSLPLFFTGVMFGVSCVYGAAVAQIGLGSAPATAAVPAGPSLEETQKWIAEKVAAVTFVDTDPLRYVFSFRTEFNNCELTASRTKFRAAYGINESFTDTASSNVGLSQLDEEKITVADAQTSSETGGRPGYTRLALWTLGQQKVMSWKSVTIPAFINPTPPERRYSLALLFEDREMAERVKNAFRHAIRLCIKQEADRKSAEPPKPKEIF